MRCCLKRNHLKLTLLVRWLKHYKYIGNKVVSIIDLQTLFLYNKDYAYDIQTCAMPSL